ncbi:MAG: hypothetical protein ACK551_02120 [Vampirovibrionales bacterium]|jgi:hypothetical protein
MNAIVDDIQAWLSLSSSFFSRNNPIVAVSLQIKGTVDYVMNFSSHRKLMKYRSMIYVKQLNRMETNLLSGIVVPEGDKLDRYY